MSQKYIEFLEFYKYNYAYVIFRLKIVPIIYW